MKNIFGFDNFYNEIKNLFLNKKLHHCNLISGEKGIGKASFIYNFASLILSQKENNLFENQEKIFKLVSNRSHPDLLILDIDSLNEKNEENTSKKQEINVSQTRNIIGNLKFTNVMSKNKVFIIDSIDELNFNAQNSLLKVLEEPKNNTYIFLICHNINNVINTVISRSNISNINKLDFDSFSQAIKNSNINASQLQLLYQITNSSIAKALDFIKYNGFDLYEQILECISNKNIIKIQNFCNNIDNNEYYNLFVIIINYIFSILLNIINNVNYSKNNHNSKINILLNNRNNEKIIKNYDMFNSLINDIAVFNLNKAHCINIFLLQF